MREKLECPLGAECENCKWLMTLTGQDPMTGKDTKRNECALVALVITMNQLNFNSLHIMEANQQVRNTLVEAFRKVKKHENLQGQAKPKLCS